MSTWVNERDISRETSRECSGAGVRKRELGAQEGRINMRYCVEHALTRCVQGHTQLCSDLIATPPSDLCKFMVVQSSCWWQWYVTAELTNSGIGISEVRDQLLSVTTQETVSGRCQPGLEKTRWVNSQKFTVFVGSSIQIFCFFLSFFPSSG